MKLLNYLKRLYSSDNDGDQAVFAVIFIISILWLMAFTAVAFIIFKEFQKW